VSVRHQGECSGAEIVNEPLTTCRKQLLRTKLLISRTLQDKAVTDKLITGVAITGTDGARTLHRRLYETRGFLYNAH